MVSATPIAGVAGAGERPFQCDVNLIGAAAKRGQIDLLRVGPPLVVDGPKRLQEIRRVTTGDLGEGAAFGQPVHGIERGWFRADEIRPSPGPRF